MNPNKWCKIERVGGWDTHIAKNLQVPAQFLETWTWDYGEILQSIVKPDELGVGQGPDVAHVPAAGIVGGKQNGRKARKNGFC